MNKLMTTDFNKWGGFLLSGKTSPPPPVVKEVAALEKGGPGSGPHPSTKKAEELSNTAWNHSTNPSQALAAAAAHSAAAKAHMAAATANRAAGNKAQAEKHDEEALAHFAAAQGARNQYANKADTSDLRTGEFPTANSLGKGIFAVNAVTPAVKEEGNDKLTQHNKE